MGEGAMIRSRGSIGGGGGCKCFGGRGNIVVEFI